MNIFFVDQCPKDAAKSLVDSHCVKMILETAQLLSTAHRVLDGLLIEENGKKHYQLIDAREHILLKATHINHPCAKWTRESQINYYWLYDHYLALQAEYSKRYGKRHKYSNPTMNNALSNPPINLKSWQWTPPPLAMPDEYKISNDPVICYREYYIKGKSHLHKWKTTKPGWLN